MPGVRGGPGKTLIYARIANRVVADEYAAVTAKIDALYGQPPELPADYETTGMARLRREAHARMLGNGLCTPHVQLVASDAAELTELLSFLIDWIDSDHTQLSASLHHFAGHNAYDTAALRADLARFLFLLGGDEQPLLGSPDGS